MRPVASRYQLQLLLSSPEVEDGVPGAWLGCSGWRQRSRVALQGAQTFWADECAQLLRVQRSYFCDEVASVS